MNGNDGNDNDDPHPLVTAAIIGSIIGLWLALCLRSCTVLIDSYLDKQ